MCIHVYDSYGATWICSSSVTVIPPSSKSFSSTLNAVFSPFNLFSPSTVNFSITLGNLFPSWLCHIYICNPDHQGYFDRSDGYLVPSNRLWLMQSRWETKLTLHMWNETRVRWNIYMMIPLKEKEYLWETNKQKV